MPLNEQQEHLAPVDSAMNVSRAPCVGRICIFETSVPLLPLVATTEVSKAEEMLDREKAMLRSLADEHKRNYINHPPSHAVDGRHDTCFQSPGGKFFHLNLLVSCQIFFRCECGRLDIHRFGETANAPLCGDELDRGRGNRRYLAICHSRS